jgi:cation diffusion facilitator family transporter
MTSDSFSKQDREKQILRNINIGLYCNVFLALLKITIGIVGNSRALLADGINSTSDVINNVVVKIFASLAGKPADSEHPYGHHQMETISAVVIGAFVVTTAIAIFWDSINSAFELLTQPHPQNMGAVQFLTLGTALFTIVTKAYLFKYTSAVSKRTSNTALLALSYDHRNDIFASAGVAIGITLGWLGYHWADPLAGAIVALIILKTGISILRESSDELMDTVPGDLLDKQVRIVASQIDGIKKIEEITAHRFGPYIVINITVGIDGAITVKAGDAIATEIEDYICCQVDMVRKVYVHYHPARDS